ncbi:FAD-dependent oxidoreductase [Opitutia bacterium ISCC 51]|nr:FAD-dependent oxidoreductase [Opitutae bacterium ISCC 51]QXD27680.1 FAD-dependent oxidoreductase [Opitutae bacterium ISCC 52]
MKKRIAIIGSGIAGMGSAWYLKDQYDLTVYEKNTYAGGHTNTVYVNESSSRVPVDTGFMVYNEHTYPNLVKLFSELGVDTMETSMSFGVQNLSRGLEYACTGFKTYFAQSRRLFDPAHWSLLKQIKKFFSSAKDFLSISADIRVTLGEFLDLYSLDEALAEDYLLPMTAAIWSTPPGKMLDYPALSLLRFLDNHQLLGIGIQLEWRTVVGGSNEYKKKILDALPDCVHTNRSAVSVASASDETVLVRDEHGGEEGYDFVIIATHADQALQMLEGPSELQNRLLSNFVYNKNHVVLHSDDTVMPKSKSAWASWNFRTSPESGGIRHSSTHYWMNSLQHVSENQNYFVSVDYEGDLDASKVHWEDDYTHPIFNVAAVRAQNELYKLNLEENVLFAGSYFENGFHEDALTSAIGAVRSIKMRDKKHEVLSV